MAPRLTYMADIFTKKKRSQVMSAVKSQGSKIEAEISRILKSKRIRFKTHLGSLPGKPDFVIMKTKTVIFVDSCFFHGCRYHGTIPKSNIPFWKKKLASNKDRDRAVNRQYKKMGWRVIRIWEHSISKSGDKVGLLLKTLK